MVTASWISQSIVDGKTIYSFMVGSKKVSVTLITEELVKNTKVNFMDGKYIFSLKNTDGEYMPISFVQAVEKSNWSVKDFSAKYIVWKSACIVSSNEDWSIQISDKTHLSSACSKSLSIPSSRVVISEQKGLFILGGYNNWDSFLGEITVE